MRVAAIMPCRGRAEQTVANIRRLFATAGDVPWQLFCVVDNDPEVYDALMAEDDRPAGGPFLTVIGPSNRGWQPLGYWRALELGAMAYPEATHLVNLANDLWACDNWLALAIEEYRHAWGDGDGLLGFSGDGHPYHHSCHFLISRSLLARYGGWPVWYQHNFGDRELCARAQADGVYTKSRHAWLEHCHPLRGLAPDDPVYQAGRATFAQDERLYVERRRLGWPSPS